MHQAIRCLRLSFLALLITSVILVACDSSDDQSHRADDAGPMAAAGGAPSGQLAKVTALAAGEFFTCALVEDGKVECWGENGYGALGRGENDASSPTPGLVTGISNATAISAGFRHACAVLSDGNVKCWGANESGQLGNGKTTPSATAVDVPGLTDVKTLAAARSHTCALRTDGTVRCWGGNSDGELGTGATSTGPSGPVLMPVAVINLAGATAIAAGGYTTCALLKDGLDLCWGANSVGQLGNGKMTTGAIEGIPTPAPVPGLMNVTGVTVRTATCAALSDGTAQCWGQGLYGNLGNGKYAGSLTPIRVSDLSDVAAISAGGEHTCALRSGGTVHCFGFNEHGQLGNGTMVAASTTPVQVSGLTGVTAIATGYSHACALMRTGAVQCWGSGALGQLGNGERVDQRIPQPVSSDPASRSK